MNRTTSTLLSVGVSAALLALGVRFIYNHNIGFRPGHDQWLGWHHYGMMGGGTGIIMIIFWVLIIGAIVLLFSGAASKIHDSKQVQDASLKPLDILKQRYARGEMDKTEFEEKRRDLSG
jgi:putative membrane protein